MYKTDIKQKKGKRRGGGGGGGRERRAFRALDHMH